MKKFLRQASSFIMPIILCIIVPYFLIEHRDARTGLPVLPSPGTAVLGGIIGLVGTVFAVLSFRLIIKIGNGTIMPWDPSKKLVVVGLYRYVRNPMILSLLVVLLGEAVAFESIGIYILAAVFFIINTLYFRFSEEPGLEKRFGEEYLEYKRNVPRWMPRVAPWKEPRAPV
jgi:protein-S-isoprenylcysteine O-methyltransferase Ste14